jgi:hypothetical protein
MRHGLAWLSLPNSKAGAVGCQLPSPLSERHAGLEQVCPSSNFSVTIDRVFSKLFRLSSMLFFQIYIVIFRRLQRYPDLVGHLGAQFSFFGEFFFFFFFFVS